MQNDPFCNAKGALLVENGAAATLKTDRNDSRKLYNRFFVCNDFFTACTIFASCIMALEACCMQAV